MALVLRSKKKGSFGCTPEVSLKQTYMDAFNDVEFQPGTVDSGNVDFGFSGLDEQTLRELNNFKPQKIVNLLIERAGNPTLPHEFLQEMNELINFGETLKIYHGTLFYDKDTKRFNELVKKYGINLDSTCTEPDVITLERLTFIYPHYYIPFHSQRRQEMTCILGLSNVNYPFFLEFPQFGGLIPSRNSKALMLDVKKAIITLHVFCLFENERYMACRKKPFIPFQAQLMLLKKRIDSSVLSETRRVCSLQNFGVIDSDGELTWRISQSYGIVSQYSHVKEIEWSQFFN